MDLEGAKAEALDALRAGAGPDGMFCDELEERVGRLAMVAATILIDEGRVRLIAGERLVLTAAQRELDALLAECPPTLRGSKAEG